MRQPPGFELKGKESFVCRLKKSLYGLKQAPKVWNQEISGTLIGLGFTQLVCDSGLFVNKERKMFLGIWVDDIPVFYADERDLQWLLTSMRKTYQITDSKLNFIIGIKVTQSDDGIKLNQGSYIERKAQEFKLNGSKGVFTPMDVDLKNLNVAGCPGQLDKPFREVIGAIMYGMVCTRPDIAFSVSVLSRNLDKPVIAHWEAAKRVLSYLYHSKDDAICFDGSGGLNLEVYADSNDDPYPTCGYVIKFGGGPVSWRSFKQKAATASSADSELMCLLECVHEVLWLVDLLDEFGFKVNLPVVIFQDNQACIAIASDKSQVGRTKHVLRKIYCIRDAIRDGRVALKYCQTCQMVADIFTKQLGRNKFIEFKKKLVTCCFEK